MIVNFLFFNCIIYVFMYVCIYLFVCVYMDAHVPQHSVGIKGQLVEVNSLLLPRRSWGWKSGCQSL